MDLGVWSCFESKGSNDCWEKFRNWCVELVEGGLFCWVGDCFVGFGLYLLCVGVVVVGSWGGVFWVVVVLSVVCLF